MTGMFYKARRMHSHRIKRDFGRGVARSRTRNHAHGFTMIEVLVALAVTAVMLAGVATMINSSLEDTRGQQAALYQQQVGVAAKQLIQTNAQALSQATQTIVPFSQLSTFLPAGMQSTNAYGQTPCLLVTKQGDGSLLGLLVTEGGTTIKDSELGYIAANSGQGGGSIPATNNASGQAIGAYGAWTAPKPSGACTTPTGVGHLASQVYNGATATQNSDYLYRVSVPGNPQANTMQVPIVLAQQQLDYTACTTAGAIAADAAGNVVNCLKNNNNDLQWLPQAAYHWRGQVADEAALGSVTGASLSVGDVVMTMKTNRAYTYTGTGPANGWQALAVNEAGELVLGNAHAIGDSCTPDPTKTTTSISTEGSGLVVSCQPFVLPNSTTVYEWLPQAAITPGTNVTDCALIMTTPGATDYNCPSVVTGNWGGGAYSFNSTNGTYSYTKNVSVTLTKPGAVNVVTWAHMNDGQCPIPAASDASRAQMSQSVDIYPAGSTTSLAHTESQTPTLTEDSGGINNSLTQAVAKGDYTVTVVTNWATYDNLSTPWQSSYCGANNVVIANTPVAAGWTINTYY